MLDLNIQNSLLENDLYETLKKVQQLNFKILLMLFMKKSNSFMKITYFKEKCCNAI
jgi:hypothetical protein